MHFGTHVPIPVYRKPIRTLYTFISIFSTNKQKILRFNATFPTYVPVASKCTPYLCLTFCRDFHLKIIGCMH